jgi:hypothetical protein
MEKRLLKEKDLIATPQNLRRLLRGPLERPLKRRCVCSEEEPKKPRVEFQFDQLFNSIIASLNEDPFPDISWDFDD